MCAVDEANDHNISIWDWQKGDKGHKITETKVFPILLLYIYNYIFLDLLLKKVSYQLYTLWIFNCNSVSWKIIKYLISLILYFLFVQ